MGDDIYGPALPPNIAKSLPADRPSAGSSTESSSISGTQRKRRHSNSSTQSSDDSSDQSSSEDSSEDSSHDCSRSKRRNITSSDHGDSGPFAVKVYGPSMPVGAELYSEEPANMIGPVLPAHLVAAAKARQEEEEEMSGFGPLPAREVMTAAEFAATEIEHRANRMKNKLLGLETEEKDSGEAKRETWMLDLPPELLPDFGITARKFRTKGPVDGPGTDRSAWTDTPADRERKQQEALEGKSTSKPTVSVVDLVQAQKDREYAKQVEEFNKSTRAKSLMDMHTSTLHKEQKKKKSKDKDDTKKKHKHHQHKDKHHKDKKNRNKDKTADKKEKSKKKKACEPPVVERKPFDREKDFLPPRMDAAKRNSIVSNSQQLGGRFGYGKAKFL